MTNASSSSIESGPYGPVFQLIPGVQSYDWGKTVAQGSLVAEFAESTSESHFKKEDGKPYAELWMGTHSTLPSNIIPPKGEGNDQYPTLSSYLQQYPDLVGKKVQERFFGSNTWKGELPFLFKILSIGKALSIQAHPDKELAKRLHAEKPKMYKDDNHKPEMAIALTKFKGFCGFRPLKQIVQFIEIVPEFQSIINPNEQLQSSLSKVKSASSVDAAETKKLLRDIFSALMNADEALVKQSVTKIAERYDSAIKNGKASTLEVEEDLAKLVITLNQQFPEDVGVLCSFVLNVVHLEPGQAAFLKANEPHAYIDGEIVECMAASDNVVRAGLTPKARDVQVLVEMLTYEDSPSDEKRMQPQPFKPDSKSENVNKYTQSSGDVPSLLYDPPIDEFSVVRTVLQESERETHRAISGPSILIVTSGKGSLSPQTSSSHTFSIDTPGKIYFVGAETPVTLQATGSEPLITYRAFVEAS
ncbi:hypothetical protein L7F22_042033 [Adiantum nelumboides]|nr:hypothetical protein [Adiantum nelumboides]